MEWNLVIAKGEHKGKTIPIRLNPFVIGRDHDCQLRSVSPYVSHRHCMLIRRGNSLTLRDCHSTNGTFVNARKMGEVELRPGDRLEIGPLAFVVSVKGQRQQKSPPPHVSRIVSEEAIADLLLEMDKEDVTEQEPESDRRWNTGPSIPRPENPPGNGTPNAAQEKARLSPADVAAAILSQKSFAWLRKKAGNSADS